MDNTGAFVPEFPIDDPDAIPDIVLTAAAEPPLCPHFLPRGFFTDIVVCRTTDTGQRGECIRVLAPTTDPLPRQQWAAAIADRALVKATWRECFPSGFCSDMIGWALVEAGRIVALDERWADKAGPVAAIFGAAGRGPDVAVFADPLVRSTPGLCPVCGQPDWRG